jgi:hypothetical protein
MANSVVNKTSGFSTAEQPSHTTASITPAANSVALLMFSSLVPGQTTASTPTVSGNGRTWTKVRAVSAEADACNYLYVGTGGGTAGAITITHAVTESIGCTWLVDEVTGCDLSNPIVQSAGGSGTTGNPTANLAAFASVDNSTYGGGSTSENISAMGSGFTQLTNFPGAFDILHFSEWKVANDTSVDIDVGGNNGNWGLIAAEIRVASGGGTEATKTPTTGSVVATGLTPSVNSFTNVRYQEVLINAAGSPISNRTGLRLSVWYSGQCAGASDLSYSDMTTGAAGTASYSLATGTLVLGQKPFGVITDGGASLSSYTCGLLTLTYT